MQTEEEIIGEEGIIYGKGISGEITTVYNIMHS